MEGQAPRNPQMTPLFLATQKGTSNAVNSCNHFAGKMASAGQMKCSCNDFAGKMTTAGQKLLQHGESLFEMGKFSILTFKGHNLSKRPAQSRDNVTDRNIFINNSLGHFIIQFSFLRFRYQQWLDRKLILCENRLVLYTLFQPCFGLKAQI